MCNFSTVCGTEPDKAKDPTLTATSDNSFKGNEMPKDTNERSNGIFKSTSVPTSDFGCLDILGGKKKSV